MRMGKRLKQELDARGMKPVELCALVPDLDLGTLSALYSRDSGNSKFAPAIAKALDVELHWLLTGEGDKTNAPSRALRDFMRHAYKGDPDTPGLTEDEIQEFYIGSRQSFPEGAHILRSAHEVPAVGTTQAGPPDRLWQELNYPVGYSDQYLEVATPDPHAYALRVVGNSMAPRIMEGEWLMVEPSSEAQPGYDVVVRTTDGKVMVKRLASRHNDAILLESINEAFQRITLMAHEIDFMHPIGGIFPPRAIKQRVGDAIKREEYKGPWQRVVEKSVEAERRKYSLPPTKETEDRGYPRPSPGEKERSK